MKIFDKTPDFDFMSKRRLAMMFSIALLIISIAALAIRGLNFGIDFTGGTLIELGYEEDANLDEIRTSLEESQLGQAVVQHFGNNKNVLIRIAPTEGLNSADVSDNVVKVLKGADLRRVEFVGPQFGEELTNDGGIAMLLALFCILLYVSLRFEKRFAVGSVAALFHDVIIVLGFFALTQIKFEQSVLAAILAVIGYSLNDTIVVFDRIRENFLKVRKKDTEEIMNISLNQTLTRTVITSFTTLLVLIALYLLGGEVIKPFALALIIGVVIGTYSSMYVASTTALALGVSKEDLMPVEKEGAEADGSMP
ncbi:MAG: protein translocase subunit SecF [Gammaproteobacteria bacterium]